MLDSGVDGIGLHLQLDARRADPALFESGLLADAARAVFARVADWASVQVVGGLTTPQAQALDRDGLKAFVISGNLGLADPGPFYTLPAAEITAHIQNFMQAVSAA